MHPRFVLWQAGQLFHVAAGPVTDERSDSIVDSAIAEAVSARMAGPHFSFLHYGSGDGAISARVASACPNASGLSVDNDPSAMYVHQQRLATTALANNVLCATPWARLVNQTV